ncbi:MAG: 2-succinyl-5-enolpyruvyl-6-hydroxy-3-cyclohexene-1-carboxylate synthase [Lachnospiraceae bacterium]|nr:2-succinyl-5-enolpyruvyl-6-hydroxy-3-cyclohexene-1-carboxylate synthase [Lachnospiraceae bacterium]
MSHIDMYLFPYKKIKEGSKIILYGAGNVGKHFYSQLQYNKYADVLKWVDRDYKKYQMEGLSVENIQQDYANIYYDAIVIAIDTDENNFDIIKSELERYGAAVEKIVWEKMHLREDYPVSNKPSEEVNRNGYTVEKNIQILIALLKKYEIKKIIVSPGTANMCFAASVQNDPFFELFSCVDERSAAYMACGLAAESGEAVALSCTGATASRNYYPGLTEAYYRKLPVVAITSSQFFGNSGNLIPQMLYRDSRPTDIALCSVALSSIHTQEEEWLCALNANRALSELFRHGGGPVHINLETAYSTDYSVKTLPEVKRIERISTGESFPKIAAKKIAIAVGAHRKWNARLLDSVETFCQRYGAVVLCNWFSNYSGKYGVFPNLISDQVGNNFPGESLDLLIHMGEVTDYPFNHLAPKEVWRVNPDGEMRDLFKKLSFVFEMDEEEFFGHYTSAEKPQEESAENSFYKLWNDKYTELLEMLPELPFSNTWCAYNAYNKLPPSSTIYLGILNTVRNWNFFKPRHFSFGYANTGGFGIDGGISSLVGAALSNPVKIFYGIFGDLSFFYDMNCIGNRHIGNNLRIMVVNNGGGAEFRLYDNPWQKFGKAADKFGAAAGHFGDKSAELIRDYTRALGFRYWGVHTKAEFLKSAEVFFDESDIESSILMEVFTEFQDESEAMRILKSLGNDEDRELQKH